MKYQHPYTCCKYPQRKVPVEIEKNCEVKCADKKDGSDCCLTKCVYRDTGIWLNGVFNPHALVKLYENFLEENGAGKYDQWVATVEKSVIKCSYISKICELLFKTRD